MTVMLKEGMNIKVVLLPDGDDPDSFSRKQSAASFTEYIKSHEVDFIRFKTNLLLESAGEDPIKRAALITDIVQSISIIPDAIVRSVYTKECSRLLDVNEEILLREVNKKKFDQITKENTPSKDNTAVEAEVTKKSEDNIEQDVSSENAPDLPKRRAASPLDTFERSLVRYMIRYGHRIIFSCPDEETGQTFDWAVLPYIMADLQQDEIEFQHPLYSQMAREAVDKYESEGEHLERYFLSHPDPEISKTAVDMVSEKYQLSKIHTKFQKVETEEERLAELVPRALFELKNAIVCMNIKKLRDEIKKAGKEKDTVRITELMSEITALNGVKAALAKQLGERIISPL